MANEKHILILHAPTLSLPLSHWLLAQHVLNDFFLDLILSLTLGQCPNTYHITITIEVLNIPSMEMQLTTWFYINKISGLRMCGSIKYKRYEASSVFLLYGDPCQTIQS